ALALARPGARAHRPMAQAGAQRMETRAWGRHQRAARGGRGAFFRSRGRGPRCGRSRGHHAAGRAGAGGARASGAAGAGGNCFDLPPPGLHRGRRSGDRDGVLQLRGAEHSRRASRARRARHALPRPRAGRLRAAHAHLAGSSPDHGAAASAGARPRARQGLPPRRARCHPFAQLPPDRRAGGGRTSAFRRSQGHPRTLRARVLRRQRAHPPAAVLFSIHRTQRRARRPLHLLLGPGLPHLQAQRLDRAAGLRHGGSGGVWLRGLRSGKVLRLCLRHGRRAHGHDPLPGRRHPALLQRRPPLPGAIPMRVLLAWLREFAPTRLAPEELAQRLSLAGLAVDRADAVALELDLTSNRPDWLSHYGVAREIAAVCGTRLAPLPAAEVPQGACPIPVAIEDPQGCGRYCAALFEQVRIGDSAGAVAERLQQLDQRPINNVADLTNYTLWEMGHPTHAFDADTLRGGEIRVRRARPGEQLTTLDGVERTLDAADLVIADAERPIALAGVMGGEATKVTARTRRVLLESAWFDPGTVRRSARRHGLHTDASHRFERGADPEAAPLAARLIAMRMAGLKARHAGGLGDARGHRPEPQPIPLRAAMIERMLGKAVDAAESARTLENLGCRSL